MSNTTKHKKKAKEKKIRNYHAVNAHNRKAGPEKLKADKRVDSKVRRDLQERLNEADIEDIPGLFESYLDLD